MLTLGLIINPFAGIGGALGLKGSDGEAAVKALSEGAEKKAQQRTHTALEGLQAYREQCQFVTCQGEMGEVCLAKLGLPYRCLELVCEQPSTAADTRRAAKAMLAQKVDVLVFAGGDGTARDICAVVGDAVPVLGIPAGVKIHSSVYGITPLASGEVLQALIKGQLVDIKDAEVRDLDEDAFRNNVVRARHFGDMRVPQLGNFVQAVKQGGVEVEALVLDDIANDVIERMDDDTLYFIGSGKTTETIMNHLGLANTLLGVDAIKGGELVDSDVNEPRMWQLLQAHKQARAVVSIMGGQGHVFGRGNQQFSPRILDKLGKPAFEVVSTKTKISELNGRPLVIDSTDVHLDQRWAGSIEVITGYRDRIVYPLI